LTVLVVGTEMNFVGIRMPRAIANVTIRATNGRDYIMGINHKLGIHCGAQAGSVCNVLTRSSSKDKKEKIKFKNAETRLSKLKFKEFYTQIENNKKLIGDW